MGETDLHRDYMIRVIELLKQRYRDQNVYVTGNLLLFYVEGDPWKHISPDAFVVLDHAPHRRNLYKLWEEKSPNVAFEITSSSTRKRDEVIKPKIYAEIGVAEYFLFDPTSDYLLPPLQGYRLVDGIYERIEPNADGRLECLELGLLLEREAGELVLYDAATGERLLERWEAEQAAREAAEAELRRLRGEVDGDSGEEA